MTSFRLPDLGEGLQDAEIVAWHVSAGDHVVADQPLVSVETAKAVVDIPSPLSGRIAEIHGFPGDVVPVGAVLVDFTDEAGPTSESVVGELPHAAAEPRPVSAPVKAAPAVRRLAHDLGIDLAAVTGTGPEGAISLGDVRAAAKGAPTPTPGGVPLRGPRRAMAEAMTRAGAEAVGATVNDEADITAWPADADPTLRLIAAVVAASAAEPSLNAWYDATAGRRVLHGHVDLGIAMDTPDGLFVPVLRGAEALSPQECRSRLEAMKASVRDRSIAAADLKGQTITLSNFGTVAGHYAQLVVVPPQVAILGAGRIREAVRAVSGEAKVRRILPLSLSFDHRVVTGGEAGRFLAAAIAALETV